MDWEQRDAWSAKRNNACEAACIVTSPNLAGPDAVGSCPHRLPLSSAEKSGVGNFYIFILFFISFRRLLQIGHTQLGRHGEFSCLFFFQCADYTNTTNRKSKRFLVPRPRSRPRDPLSFDSPEISIPPSIHSNELVNILEPSMLSSSSVCLRPRS